jgi:hypothetical protein
MGILAVHHSAGDMTETGIQRSRSEHSALDILL